MNRKVFRRRLKIDRDEHWRRSFGKLFQMEGAALEKLLSPKPLSLVMGTTMGTTTSLRSEETCRDMRGYEVFDILGNHVAYDIE